MKLKISEIIKGIKNIKRNSLKFKIWTSLIIFSILILSFLWLFQIIFLDSFYERAKIKDIANTIKEINTSYRNMSLDNKLDDLVLDNGVCIQIVSSGNVVYDSAAYNKGCMSNKNISDYKNAFINSLLDEETYKLTNPKYNNEVLIRAIKLNPITFAFVSTSLDPLDSAIKVLQNQLIMITLIVLFLSFIVAFFISKKISKPIEEINANAAKIGKGDYSVVIKSTEDIDELNQLINTLNNTNKELSKTEKLRRELLANVSHDLKTPLTMIKAYAEMVRDLTIDDKVKSKENLNVIIEESDRLNLLVNDILDLSVLQSNTQELDYSDFDIVELINNILKRYRILESNQKYSFIFNYDKRIVIRADIKRIEQVIYNLLNNAVNYTGDDKTIKINIIENNLKARIEISDTGIGINKEELKLIWKKYYKVDKSHRRDKVGTGIGLSIVENILIKHKFKYGVDSIKEEGTTFWFEVKKIND